LLTPRALTQATDICSTCGLLSPQADRLVDEVGGDGQPPGGAARLLDGHALGREEGALSPEEDRPGLGGAEDKLVPGDEDDFDAGGGEELVGAADDGPAVLDGQQVVEPAAEFFEVEGLRGVEAAGFAGLPVVEHQALGGLGPV